MTQVPARLMRARFRLTAGAVTLALAAVPVLAEGSATATTAATGPNISHLSHSPKHPVQGKGFKVRFRTTTGGSYVVFAATPAKGGPIAQGSAPKGTFTTKTLGKSLHAGKYTLGVDLTTGGKTKRITIKLVIKK